MLTIEIFPLRNTLAFRGLIPVHNLGPGTYLPEIYLGSATSSAYLFPSPYLLMFWDTSIG